MIQDFIKCHIAEIRVVILAAGGASRMQPLSTYVAKPMLPIKGKPLLGCILDSFYDAGFRHFIICFGVHEEQVIPYIENLQKSNKDMHLSLVRQEKPMGMADAVLLTKDFVLPYLSINPDPNYGEQLPFIVTAGDILFSAKKIQDFLEIHLKNHAVMTLALAFSPDSRMANGYGNVKLNGDKVERIVEKPGEANKIDDYYSEPMYIFNAPLFDKLPLVQPSKRGEKELQEAMQMLIDDHGVIAGYNVIEEPIGIPKDGEYHITYPRDFLAMNFRHLIVEGFNIAIKNPNVLFHHPIAISEQFKQIGDHTKLGPNVFCDRNVSIGSGCNIQQSYLFPNCKIEDNCELIHCIIYEGTKVAANSKLLDKIILPEGIFDLN